MSTLCKTGRAIRTGFGLALVAALAIVNGCAAGDAADELGQSAEPSSGQATEALDAQALYRCTLAGGTEMGTLAVWPGPGGSSTCRRYSPSLMGSSGMYCVNGVCPSCWALHTDLGCQWI
jgi:hypothetical protein